MRLLLAAVLFAGCYRGSGAPPVSSAGTGSDAALVVSAQGVGPINAHTKATLYPLRQLLAGYDVAPVNDAGLEYHVSQGGKELFFVVPGEANGEVYNVHITNPAIEVVGKRWRVGAKLASMQDFNRCECWGEHLSCYRKHEHVAALIETTCTHDVEPADIESGVVKRIVWSVKPLGEPDAIEPHEGGDAQGDPGDGD